MSSRSNSRATVAAHGLLAVTNVVAVGSTHETLSNLTQWLLMPTLVVVLLTLAPRGRRPLPRLRTATLVALGFSWLGDLLPDLVPQSASFLAMVGAFLLAQLAFIVGFLPFRRQSILTRRRGLVAAYAVAFVGLVLACAGGAGSLLVPVIVYGATLTVMAVLATGVNTLTGVGGAVFMLSDSLIALGAFRGGESRPLSVAVMATYAVAELLLVLGVQQRRRSRSTTSGRVTRSPKTGLER